MGFPFLGKGLWVLRKQNETSVEKLAFLLQKVDLKEK